MTRFVAAESKTGHIITLDENPWTTQFLTQFWAFIQGSREMHQMDSRDQIQPRRQFRMSELFLVQEILSLVLTEIQFNENGLGDKSGMMFMSMA